MAKPDPRKLKDDAQEAVAKGKWKKALEAYAELEKLEPRDGTWPQKAGDMSRKLGKKEDAVAALGRAAETFSRNGFLLKAVACCKVILEIDPGHTDTQSKLAALHSERGGHAAAGPAAMAVIAGTGRQGARASIPAPVPAPAAPVAPAPAPVRAAPAPVPVRAAPVPAPRAPAPLAAPVRAPAPVAAPPPVVARAPVPAPVPPPAPAPVPPRARIVAPPPEPPPEPEVEELLELLPEAEPEPEVEPEPAAITLDVDDEDDLELLAAEAAAAIEEPAPVIAPPPPPRAAPPPDISRGAVPPRARSLPPGVATLDQVSLGKVVPGARRSKEISTVTLAGAFEIPLDDGFDAAFEELTGGGQTAPPAVAPAAPAAEPEHAQTVRELFPRTPLFSSLDERRLRALIERVRLCHFEPGQTVFTKGDPGDALYVVAEGEVAVHAEGPESAELARLGEGQFFGEIALVTSQPRSATVVAAQATELLAIDGHVLFDLIEDQPEILKVVLRFLRDRLVGQLVNTNDLFSPFTPEERTQLVSRFRFIEAEAGAALIEQGKKASGLFVLLAGQARVDLEGKPVNDLSVGELFGEMSLLAHGAATATVNAVSKCYLLSLSRSDFTELIMTHPQVLEHLSRIAEDRQRHLDDFKAGKVSYGDGSMQMV